MLSQPIRAIYEDGQLRPLDPVNLVEGQEVELVMLSGEDRVRSALADLLVEPPDPSGEDTDEDALAQEVEEGFRGQPPLSESLVEERRQGP
ncbi:MAG: antitoxin family protein [Chloroflexota bacterium]